VAGAQRQAAAKTSQSTTIIRPQTQIIQASPPPSNTPVSGTKTCPDTVGNYDLSAGENISCGFAKNILIALATYYQQNQSWPVSDLSVTSPDTAQTYSVACTDDSGRMDCHNDDAATPDNGAGNNDVTFPDDLANGTGPN